MNDKNGAQKVGASKLGMISTQHYRATAAGVEILAEGGNAVDAAVAAAFALTVCEPQACGLGGQTMIQIHLTAERRKTLSLDGSSRAPSRATVEELKKRRARLIGHRATTVPSTPAVLAYAAERYGTLPLSRLLEPAIRLARDGYRISALQHHLQDREVTKWRKGNAGALFLKDGQTPFPVGARFKQAALAETLSRLATHGVEDFYTGRIAAAIHDDMQKHDGFLHREDLGRIPWPIERRPISCRFEDLRLLTFPPPAAGRALVAMLNVLSHFSPKRRNPETPRGVVLLSEVIRRAQLDRRDRPFDPNFYPQVDERRMTGKEYAKLVARQIRRRLRQAAASAPLAGETSTVDREAAKSETDAVHSPGIDSPGIDSPGIDSPGDAHNMRDLSDISSESTLDDPLHGETTHLSTADRHGNMVALTQSIERVYGSFAASPELGFLYNNYMSAFEYSDYTNPYFMRPNSVPWASVAPTIVFRGRKPWLAIGSPGSERIVSAIMQVILRLRDQPPLAAVVAPRFHCSVKGRVSLEDEWFRDDIPPALVHRGFSVDRRGHLAFYLGCIQLIVREGKTYIGVADPRRDGAAGGPQSVAERGP
jgi:gamma-glutamyltranspeptidase/glutathione hydrolase